MELSKIPFLIGWVSMFLGIFSGAYIGLHFHKEDWEGGYSSYRRRLWRLGHIAFFGIGFVALFAGLTMQYFDFPGLPLKLINAGLFTAAIGMPLICFLSGWKKIYRHLFFIPVLGLSTTVFTMLSGMI